MDVWIAGVGIITIYIVLTFVNVWCLSAMLWLAFDAAFMQKYEKYTLTKEYRRAKLRVLPGGKDGGDRS